MKFPVLKGFAILAPMAGITDVAFRALCRSYGAALTYTEFVNNRAIMHDNVRTRMILRKDILEKPSAVQLFGNSSNDFVSAARLIEKEFDIIDINFGCPAHKITKTGAGSALLESAKKVEEIVSAVVNAVKKPVTVKIRLGLTAKTINVIDVAKAAERAGACAVTVHGRTAEQGYSGKADWMMISEVKKSVGIPVIGNGDVTTPEEFKKKLEESGVDYIMLGRGALNNPYIFKQIEDYMSKGTYKDKDIKQIFEDYMRFVDKYSIPLISIKHIAMNITKGYKGSTTARKKIIESKNVNEIRDVIGSLNC